MDTGLQDKWGREISYMRISVTDRCNLRCRYCMPKEGVPLVGHKDILTFGEIEQIVRTTSKLGIRKYKITGGEPLLRVGISGLIGSLTQIPGVEEVTITTNGIYLAEFAMPLYKNGIRHVNVSLDTVNNSDYENITGRVGLNKVLSGIDAAKQAGLKVKLNCVISGDRHRKDWEVPALAKASAIVKYAVNEELIVRFIELMPMGAGTAYKCLNNDRLYKYLQKEYKLSQTICDEPIGNGPAVYYDLVGTNTKIGFISPIHHKFCSSCNRLRLSSTGFMRLCLGQPDGIDLRGILRGSHPEQLSDCIVKAAYQKPSCHTFEFRKGMQMNRIGG